VTSQPGSDATADTIISARPERLRRWCLLGAGVVFVLFTVAAVLLRVGSGKHAFGVADQIAVFVLGAAIAAGIMMPARSRLRADSEKLWVRNAFGTHEVPWNLVTAVRFDDRSPWATLEFPDGDLLAVMAVRATDGELAVHNVQALRSLCDAHGAAR
jgi:hypothetical protein